MRHRLPGHSVGLAASLRSMPTASCEDSYVPIRRSEHFESIHVKSGRQAQSDGLVFFVASPTGRCWGLPAAFLPSLVSAASKSCGVWLPCSKNPSDTDSETDQALKTKIFLS